jgi:hypothetical protein
MYRKMIAIMICVVISGVFISSAFAELAGNERKGKYLYRKIYETCHVRGEVNSDTPPVSPNAKTQDQWERLYNQKDFTEMGCKEEWSKLSEEDLLNIFTYLQAHAADSPSPAKCQ